MNKISEDKISYVLHLGISGNLLLMNNFEKNSIIGVNFGKNFMSQCFIISNIINQLYNHTPYISRDLRLTIRGLSQPY